MSTLIISALGLVAALAWNDTIKLIFTEIFGTPNQIMPMIIYSVTVTIIAVILILSISNVAKKLK
jgi:hypothetical protein